MEAVTKIEKNHVLGLIINALLHSCILFIILSLLFFYFIAELTTKAVDSNMQTIMKKQGANVVQALQEKYPHLNMWVVAEVAAIMKTKYQTPYPAVEANNLALKTSIFCTIAALMLGAGILIVYCLFRNLRIGFKHIVIENMATFAFVIVLELWFFLNIASKYIPTTNTQVMQELMTVLQQLTAT